MPASVQSAAGSSGPAAGRVAAFDLDADGDLDLADVSRTGVWIWRNTDGRFADVTGEMLGSTAAAEATGALAGDFDNDGQADLLILRPGGVSLLRRNPAGGFVDVTTRPNWAGLSVPRRRLARRRSRWHLDLFVASGSGDPASPSGTQLLRNNGNGRFTDITSASGLGVARPVLAVVPTDYDNRRDIDLLLVPATGNALLFRNFRDGTFRDVASEVGLTSTETAAMAASAT